MPLRLPPALRRLQQAHPFPAERPTLPTTNVGDEFWFEKGNARLLKKFVTPDLADDPKDPAPSKVYVEFGSWKGRSAEFILSLNTKCVLVCVDIWVPGDKSIGNNKAFQVPEDLYRTFLHHMWPYRDRVVPVRMDGRKAVPYLKQLGVHPDLIYLDMGHLYEDVQGDLAALYVHYPDVPILGDDFEHWPGVARAVKEAVPKYGIHRLEVNQNCYALLPAAYDKRYDLKELRFQPVDARPDPHQRPARLAVVVPDLPATHAALPKCLARLRAVAQRVTKDVRLDVYVVRRHAGGGGGQDAQRVSRRRRGGGGSGGGGRRSRNGNGNGNSNSTRRRAPAPASMPTANHRGWLLNVGCALAKADGHATVLFQDPHWLPDDALAPYYAHYPLEPMQLGYRTPGYTFEKWHFGSLLATVQDVERLNGYPNDLRTECCDNELVLRFRSAELPFTVPKAGANRANGGKGVPTSAEWRRKVQDKAHSNKHSETWRTNGVRQVRYAVVSDVRADGVRRVAVRGR